MYLCTIKINPQVPEGLYIYEVDSIPRRGVSFFRCRSEYIPDWQGWLRKELPYQIHY